MGLEVGDLGPLRFAHVLEEMLIVWANAGSHGGRFNYYLRPQPAAPAAPARNCWRAPVSTWCWPTSTPSRATRSAATA